MRRYKNILLAILLGPSVLVSPAVAFAQTTADSVVKVIACMKAHICKNVVSAKTYDQAVGEQVVFVSNGKRYTFYWNGDVDHYTRKAQPKQKQLLSVWIQPDGTHDPSSIASVDDDGLNGDVNFGMDGVSTDKNFFHEAEAKGLECRSYWQKEYDAAIAVALRQLVPP